MEGMFLLVQTAHGSNTFRYTFLLLILPSHGISIILLYHNDRLLIISILGFKLQIHNQACKCVV